MFSQMLRCVPVCMVTGLATSTNASSPRPAPIAVDLHARHCRMIDSFRTSGRRLLTAFTLVAAPALPSTGTLSQNPNGVVKLAIVASDRWPVSKESKRTDLPSLAASLLRDSAPALRFTKDSSDWSVLLPTSYQAALQRAVPGFRPFSTVNFYNMYAPTPNGSVGAVIGDVDHDGRPDIAIAGSVHDSLVTVVLLYTTPQGIVGEKLLQKPWLSVPAPSSTLTQDSATAVGYDLATLRQMRDTERRQDLDWSRTPDGKAPRAGEILTFVREHGVAYVRWQDGDCKQAGWQWTVRAGRVLKTTSSCYYGE